MREETFLGGKFFNVRIFFWWEVREETFLGGKFFNVRIFGIGPGVQPYPSHCFQSTGDLVRRLVVRCILGCNSSGYILWDMY